MSYQGKYQKVYICEDCVFIFRTHTPTPRRHPFCPNCGRNEYTEQYVSEKFTSKKRVIIPWTDEELEVLEKIHTKELSPHQVSIILGRSIGSVRKRLERLPRKKGRTKDE